MLLPGALLLDGGGFVVGEGLSQMAHVMLDGMHGGDGRREVEQRLELGVGRAEMDGGDGQAGSGDGFFEIAGGADKGLEGLQGGLTGDGFDAADAGGDGALVKDFEETDVTRLADVRATAKLHGVAVELGDGVVVGVGRGGAADLDNADEVAVFVAEELHDVGAGLDIGVFKIGPSDGGIRENAGVDEFFDVGELLGGEGGGVEVEGELFGRDGGAFLGGLARDDLVESPVKEVGDGVVALDGGTAGGLELDGDVRANGGGVGAFDEVEEGVAGLLRIEDAEGAAGFGIE